ncbi:MAG: hypothetical protein MRY74_11620 [Neomegalonema sp.]|nr:hypothetical protein [Neomegalonema sp.]
MLATLAKLEGDPVAEATTASVQACREVFRASMSEATDIATFGRWLAAQSPNADEGLRRLTRRLINITKYEDRARLASDLERMMISVATAQDSGVVSEVKAHAIKQMRSALDKR